MPVYGSHHASAPVYSGTTNATPNTITKITFSAPSGSIYVKNTDPTNVLLVSFDGQTTWWSLAAGISISIDLARSDISVKSVSASVTYVCLVVQ